MTGQQSKNSLPSISMHFIELIFALAFNSIEKTPRTGPGSTMTRPNSSGLEIFDLVKGSANTVRR